MRGNFNASDWDMSSVRYTNPDAAAGSADLGWGEYSAVLEVVRHLKAGGERKAFTDLTIDRVSQMQNLRTDILPMKVAAEDESKETKRRA